jgi:hypothetical protein
MNERNLQVLFGAASPSAKLSFAASSDQVSYAKIGLQRAFDNERLA